MNTTTKKALSITGGSIVGVILVALATLGVQSLLQKEAPPPPTPVVQAPPAPPPMAQVIGVQPHVVTVSTTADQCHEVPSTVYSQQPVYQKKNNSAVGGTLVGGALGGLAGSAIHGSARTAAILAGAGLGAYAGHEIQSQNSYSGPQYKTVPETVYSTKCGKHTTTKKIQHGYDVTYWYNGTQGTIVMPVPPTSNTIPLPGAVDQYGQPIGASAPSSGSSAPPAPTTMPPPVTVPNQ